MTKHVTFSDMSVTRTICETIINSNIVKVDGTQGFIAGTSIYANFWSRDFLYSAPLLMKNEQWRKAVADHIFLILDYTRPEDHLMPKELDTMNPDWRVARGIIRNFFGCSLEKLPMHGKLHGHYTDALQSTAIDTNLLAIHAACELMNYPDYRQQVLDRKIQLMNGMKYYDKYIKQDGLIYQMPFSDFQDSTAREGATFMTNLLYWKVLNEMEEHFFYKVGRAGEVRTSIRKTFYDRKKGVYRGVKNRQVFNLDANLLAVYWKFDENIWRAIRMFDLPGPPTTPEQPLCEKSCCVRCVCIPGYHDAYIWSWIQGLLIMTAVQLNDLEFAYHQFRFLASIIERDKTIYDAYRQTKDNSLKQVVTWGFKSERDWTWGAAYIYEACVQVHDNTVVEL